MPRPTVKPAVLCLKTEPGVSCSDHVMIGSVPMAASVTASIIGGNSLLNLELIVFKHVSRPYTAEEIAELPPNPPSIREKAQQSGAIVEEQETGRSDGSEPLAVAVGDALRAVVGFTGQPAPDTTSATLLLDGMGWEHVEVPVFLLIGKPMFVPAVEPTAIHRAAEPGETFTQDVVITPMKTGTKVAAFIDAGVGVIRRVRMTAFRPVKKEYTAEEINELSPLQQGVPGYPLPTEYVEYQERPRGATAARPSRSQRGTW